MGCGLSRPKILDEGKAGPDHGLLGPFQFEDLLGRGCSGQTYLFTDRGSQEKVAIKCVKRPIKTPAAADLLQEIEIQAKLGGGHVNIVQAKEALLTDKHLGLVMEAAAGGNLADYVSTRRANYHATGLYLGEDEARFFFQQFINAVEYCHEHNVVHRDLKLDNTLLTDHTPPRIKLCDFGFAHRWQAGVAMYGCIGTPCYMAPELLDSRGRCEGYEGKAVDVWASGIVLVVMMLGEFPFDNADPDSNPNSVEAQSEVREQQRQSWGTAAHVREGAQKLTPECQDLLSRILETDVEQRITVAGIKEHAWFRTPLMRAYKTAADEMERLQAERDECRRCCEISSSKVEQRNMDLWNMVEVACQPPQHRVAPATSPRQRVYLCESRSSVDRKA